MIALKGIISLFLIIAVGVYASKKNIITNEMNKGLSNLLINVTMPLLIISSFNMTINDQLKSNIIKCFIYSFITLIIAMVLSKLLLKPLKVDNDNKNMIQFSNVFSNCGFMGFPIIEGLYGKEGLIYASIFNMAFTILLWTYGVGLFTGGISKENIKKVMVNPSIIAVFIGIFIMVFQVDVPEVIMTPIEMVGGMTSALSMLIIGVILSNVDFKEYINDRSLYYGVLLKLLVVPLVMCFMLSLFKGPTKVITILVLLHAMPTGAILPIFAENFDKNKGYASVLMFLTTLCSIVTFPIILMFIK